jgi:Ca2+-binding RTX toxin-like protein
MRFRGIVVSVATLGLTVGPAFVHGLVSSVAGARAECTISGTAADDTLNGTTKDDVICAKAGSDSVSGLEGNDVIRGGQGDDGGGTPPCTRGGGGRRESKIQRGPCFSAMRLPPQVFGLRGGDGSDVIKGQADDDSLEGYDQNDRLYGGQGADCLGASCTFFPPVTSEPGNDFLKSKDHVSGNDFVDGGDNTDTCRIDAGDENLNCEL